MIIYLIDPSSTKEDRVRMSSNLKGNKRRALMKFTNVFFWLLIDVHQFQFYWTRLSSYYKKLSFFLGFSSSKLLVFFYLFHYWNCVYIVIDTEEKLLNYQLQYDEQLAKQKAIDDWLPITSSRNAKWWYSAFHNVTAMVGAGVLSLPYAMSELGWYVYIVIS